MSKRVNPFVKSSVLYVLATVIGQGTSLLGTIVFTRLMTQSDYGTYSTYYSAMAILVVLVGSNLYVSINNAYIDYKEQIHSFRKSVLFLGTIILAIVSTCVLCLKGLFFKDVSWLLTLLALGHAFSFFVVNYMIYSANMENRYGWKTALLVFPNVLQLSFSLAFFLVPSAHRVEERAFGGMLGVFVCAAVAYVYIMTAKGKLIVPEYWSYALKISVPSILMSISYMIMQQSDKIMITNLCGAEETAVYSVIYYIGFAITAVNGAIAAVWQAWMFKKLDADDLNDVQIVQKWYLVFASLMVAGILMIAPEIIKAIYPESYWKFEYVAPFVLSSSMMILYTFYTVVGLYFKKSGQIAVCVAVCAMINVALNAVLIPLFGGVVACYTTMISYALLFWLSRMVVSVRIKGLFSLKLFMGFISFSTILCLLFSSIYHFTLVRYLIFGFVLLMIVVYMLTKKAELAVVISGAENKSTNC